MTLTRPFLTIMRHFSHRFLIDGLTCIRLLLLPRRTRSMFNYSSALRVVLRKFDGDPVTLQDTSECTAHGYSDVAQHIASVLGCHPKERPRQHFYHFCDELSTFFSIGTHFFFDFFEEPAKDTRRLYGFTYPPSRFGAHLLSPRWCAQNGLSASGPASRWSTYLF